jgi:hypothetical protein
MKITKQVLKDLIREELEEQEKPEYKGSASAASRLKKSVGSDEEPEDEPDAKKEKSPLEKAKDRLERAKAKGDPARIKSAEAAVKREKKKAGLPAGLDESVGRVSKSTLYRIIKEELEEVIGQAEADDISMGVSTSPRCDFSDLHQIVEANMMTLQAIANGDGPVSGACRDPFNAQALSSLDTALKDIALVLKQYEDFY